MVRCSARDLKVANLILAHDSFLVRSSALVNLSRTIIMVYGCLIREDYLFIYFF